MKTQILAIAALGLSGAAAHATGLDRSGQRVGIIFEEGNVLQFSASFSDPSVDGTLRPGFGGTPTGDVAESFQTFGLGLKYELNDKLSFALVQDEPFGVDILYPAAGFLQGVAATVDSVAITGLARYKFTDRFSVHGGLRYQQASAFVRNTTTEFTYSNDSALGYVIGAAYEIPDIALRVSLTYNSQIDHDFSSTVNGAAVPDVEVTTPESLNLAFQTGIAANTLLFGSIRYAKNSDTQVVPVAGAPSLTDLEDGADYEIGIGRRFNDKWSGSIALGYQEGGDDHLVSSLSPTDGAQYVSLGVKYDVNEKLAISGGIRYTDIGDAIAAANSGSPAAIPLADFDNNSAFSAGFRISYKF